MVTHRLLDILATHRHLVPMATHRHLVPILVTQLPVFESPRHLAYPQTIRYWPPSLIRPSYLAKNGGHVTEVTLGKREK